MLSDLKTVSLLKILQMRRMLMLMFSNLKTVSALRMLQVPADEKEALTSDLMGLFEKRRFKNFLVFVQVKFWTNSYIHNQCGIRLAINSEVFNCWMKPSGLQRGGPQDLEGRGPQGNHHGGGLQGNYRGCWHQSLIVACFRNLVWTRTHLISWDMHWHFSGFKYTFNTNTDLARAMIILRFI